MQDRNKQETTVAPKDSRSSHCAHKHARLPAGISIILNVKAGKRQTGSLHDLNAETFWGAKCLGTINYFFRSQGTV